MHRPAYSASRENMYKELIEKAEYMVLEAISFDFEGIDELPYRWVRDFCESYANFASREHLQSIACIFCNDSFKLPLCLFFHPKVIAAACIFKAMQYRQ